MENGERRYREIITFANVRTIMVRFHTASRVVCIEVEGVQVGTDIIHRCEVLLIVLQLRYRHM
jgi:hypothetical protein